MKAELTRHVAGRAESRGTPSGHISLVPVLACWLVCACPALVQAVPNQLGPSDVLILVNSDSPVSVSIADMYRRYYPQIDESQVVLLSGLPDSASLTATPADEIIARADFESLIAAPVRDYLIANNMVDSIYCLITTAGMPYRIEDSNQASYANAVTVPGSSPFPDGSDANLVAFNRTAISAASVESELALLFQIDPALTPGPDGPGVPLENRIVNPYHGYASTIKSWTSQRDILGRRSTLTWHFGNLWPEYYLPRIEGAYHENGCSAENRIMSPADIYLVARLDGPHEPDVHPIFAVKDMLDRSASVGNLSAFYVQFAGYNAADAALVVDHYPNNWRAISKSFNFPRDTTFLTYETDPVPPGAEAYSGDGSYCERSVTDHYDTVFNWLTGLAPTAGGTLTEAITTPFGGTFVWDDSVVMINSADPVFPAGAGIIGLATPGCNSGDGRPATYLTTGGPGGGLLFPCAPGAVFTSIESFNAATMFTSVSTNQAKIAEFIQMGGTAAIGHALEPGSDAIVQVEYLYENLMRDDDGDGVGDMCLAEAAYTAIPYLSWSQVLIGDPLMRYRSGPGGLVDVAPTNCPADVNGDGYVTFWDRLIIVRAYNSGLGEPRYDPAADITRDGYVTFYDYLPVVRAYNTACPEE